MATTVGQLAFVKLGEQFREPRWREGLVTSSEDNWVQVLIRADRADEIEEGVAHFSFRNKHYFLFSCPLQKLRAGCSSSVLSLDEPTGDLMSEARGLRSSDSELRYATASDRPQRRGRARVEKSDDSSSDDSADSADNLNALLEQMKKRWQGGDTHTESRRDARQTTDRNRRFPFLDRSRGTSEKKEPMYDPMSLLKNVKEGEDPLRLLLALQVAQSMKKDNRHHRRQRSSSNGSDSSSEGTSVDSVGSKHRVRGHAKAVEDYRAGKRRMFRKPVKHVRRYVKSVERSLGAKDRPFRLNEAGKRIPWGKQKSLQRTHYMFSEVLELLLRGKVEKACLQVVLCLRSIHQAALDQDWSVAWMICHLEDPFSKPKWGGDAEELGHITAYLKSMAELEKNTEKLRAGPGSAADRWEDPPKAPKKPPKKTKGDGKGKDSSKEEA